MAPCLLFEFIFFSLLLATSTGLQRCHPHDQAALESIAAVFGGVLDESISEYSSWPMGLDCCIWQGVTCTTTTLTTASYSRVMALYLYNRELVGEFPPQLCNLTALESLSMVFIGLSGPLPPCLTTGRLRQLRSLVLSRNYLSGSLPPSLFNSSLLPALTHLDISSNKLSGPLPSISHIPSNVPPAGTNSSPLQVLDLSGNFISGAIPEALYTQLPFLEELHLGNNDLVGTISPAIHNLSQTLQYLDLAHNLLSGPIPPELASLSTLSVLDLPGNRFGLASKALHSGTPFSFSLPPFLANLSNLQYLDLSSNLFYSPNIPPQWSNLTHLLLLDLSENKLSAPAPTPPHWLFRLPLQTLSLRSLRLTAHNFCEQLKLINNTIDELDISDNNLTSSARILECLCQVPFPSPEVLDLSHNPLQSPLMTNPSAVLQAPSLSALDASSCGLSGRLTDSFFSLARELSLYLSHNQLQGEVPLLFASNSSWFVELDLSHNRFTRLTMDVAVASSQSEDSSLGKFSFVVSNNRFGGGLGEFLEKLVSFKHLRTLDVSSNYFTGAVPPSIFANCRLLEAVRMGNNRLTGQIPVEVGMLSKLTSLSMHNNELKGSIPSTLSNCSSLKVLDLSHNRLDGDLQQALFGSHQNLNSLRVLLLSYNRLTGAIPASLGLSSPNLQLIGLSNNRLVGAIPPSLHLPAFIKIADSSFPNQLNSRPQSDTLYEEDITFDAKGRDAHYTYILKVLTSIDFSGNSLSGPIRPQLGELTGLIYLNLSRNNLSGSIPAELSKLADLESLDLSSNRLTGSIPNELKSLSKLGKFNVSFDEGLSGEIPAGTQLEDESSYVGDNDLCGMPKPNPCPNDQATAQHDGQRFVDWLQGWASTQGLLLGFVVGFSCTLVALRANWRCLFISRCRLAQPR
ncbi:hypothetical protein L7F22_062258 [Adiantum nelumboides]|nr:hypothetical protein [Adiantum nelumboides]